MDMRILAFETSAKSAAVAIVQDGAILGEYYQNSGQTHSRTLMQMAEDLLKKEEQLQQRLEKIKALEEEVKKKEKALKDKEKTKKQMVLRLSPGLWNEIAAWAEEDFRSINGQVEYLLSECVRQRKKG